MNDVQKRKRNFRQTKTWKNFRASMKKNACNKDAITGKPLRKGYACHHRDLREENYNILNPDNFIVCNNLTHKMIHWLYVYYVKDSDIIESLRDEMEKMKRINT